MVEFPKIITTVWVMVGTKWFCLKPYDSQYDQRTTLLEELSTTEGKLVSVHPSLYLYEEYDRQAHDDMSAISTFLTEKFPKHYHAVFQQFLEKNKVNG